VWHTAQNDVAPDEIPQWAIKLTAVAAVLSVTMICAASRNLGTRTSMVFTTVKVCLLLVDFVSMYLITVRPQIAALVSVMIRTLS
jgi:hypothetical protein